MSEKRSGKEISLSDIKIRTELKPGDIGYVTYLHGMIYREEYDYGIEFETYVADGLNEFFRSPDKSKSRVWVCEVENKIVAFMMLMDRGESAQLRFFLILQEYRGIGLGKKLMNLFFEFYRECGYNSAYLWTTHELSIAAALYKKFGFRLSEEIESTKFGKRLYEQK